MTRFVAEIGSNHCGSLERAIALVDAAAAAGFQDVKTQQFHAERLFSPEALRARPELRARERLEVPWEWHKPLANRAKEHGMGYGVTVFHASDVRRAALEADWLKVSSYSLLDVRLLHALSQQPKDVVVSTGMATAGEVESAWREFQGKLNGRPFQGNLTLLHCTSSYPAPPHEANLRSIPYMRERFSVPVGWSDHTCSMFVVGRAVLKYEAAMVELHWDLDDLEGGEWRHSYTRSRFQGCGGGESGNVGQALRLCGSQEAPLDFGPGDDGYYACDGKSGVKAPSVSEDSERAWRADPSDGMRPLRTLRATL